MPTFWAPCPGKRNATLAIALCAFRAGGADREFLLDQVVEAAGGVAGGHRQGVLDGPVAGRSVADDAHAVDAQQRRPAVFAVVVAVDQPLQRLLRPVTLGVERPEHFL